MRPGDEKYCIDGWILAINPCSLHKILETELVNEVSVLIEYLFIPRGVPLYSAGGGGKSENVGL